MTKKQLALFKQDVAEAMEREAMLLKRGLYLISDCEDMMHHCINDAIMMMYHDDETPEETMQRYAMAKELHRMMWKMLLDATK